MIKYTESIFFYISHIYETERLKILFLIDLMNPNVQSQ